jgi:hypothetical protein
MRTTINIDNDVAEVARAIALTEQRPLGRVVSDLMRRGLVQEPNLEDEKIFPVFRVSPGTAPLTNEMVQRALEEV